MLNKFRNNDKGFTLVELMMVIVILGVLAGVAIPMVGRLRTNAKLAKYESYVSTIGSTIVVTELADPDFKWPSDSEDIDEWLKTYVDIQDSNVTIIGEAPTSSADGDMIVITLPAVGASTFEVGVLLDGEEATALRETTFTLSR